MTRKYDFGKPGVIGRKGEMFRRVVWLRYDEEPIGEIVYRHATKGIRRRKYTPQLFAQLFAKEVP